MIRVLHVVTYMGRGGLESMIMNYYRRMDRKKIQFDFLVHRRERAEFDDEIENLGGKIYRLPRLIPWSRSYLNVLDRFFEIHPEYKIVHVHQDCLSSVILKAAARYNIPVRIAHSHCSSQNRDLKYPVKLWYMRSIPKYATDLIACGKDAGDWMFGGAPYHIINNAVDTSLYTYSPVRREKVQQQLEVSDHLVVGHIPVVKRIVSSVAKFFQIAKLDQYEKQWLYERFASQKSKLFAVHLGEIIRKLAGSSKLERCVYSMLTSQVPTNELITMEEADKRFPTECFNASVLMPYEDLMISVPKEYERILSMEYGAYMEFPPEDERFTADMKKWMIDFDLPNE